MGRTSLRQDQATAGAAHILVLAVLAFGSVLIMTWFIFARPCWMGKPSFVHHVNYEKGACTFVDLGTLLTPAGTRFGFFTSAGDSLRFFRDPSTPGILMRLRLDLAVEIDPHPINWFRITFGTAPSVSYLKAEPRHDLQPLEIHSATFNDPLIEPGIDAIRNRERPSWWNHVRFLEKGFEYSCPGDFPLDASSSPGRDFVVLTTATEGLDGNTYLEIYRRRDQRRLLQFKIERCAAMPNYPFVGDPGWLSDQDFLMVTGGTFSDCLVCRFQK